MLETIRPWAAGRWWQWRLPLLVLLVVQAARPLREFGEPHLFAGITFGAAICGLFLAASLGDLSWYIADARARELDLLSFSPDGSGHDWAFLLRRAGLLQKDLVLARFTRFVGWCVLLASTGFALRLLWWMKSLPKPEADGFSATAP